MIKIFLATLNPMLTLFICIAVGFISRKTRILPESAGSVMAKLETWIFCPALSFATMARFCTPSTIGKHAVNVLFGTVCVSIGIGLSILISRLIIRKPTPERGVYAYALAYANGGYLGDPLVLALFGEEMLSYYKLFYLPFSLTIYTWGLAQLIPSKNGSRFSLKQVMNPPTVGMLLGIFVGLTGLGAYLPSPVTSALDSLKACMGPIAMLLAGFTVAGFGMKRMLGDGKVYLATALRLVFLPALQLMLLFALRALLHSAFGLTISNVPLYLAFFATAAPLGLNTVVFPAAYGRDAGTGASMALISHSLCVLTIPLLYLLMYLLIGPITV